MNQLQTVEKAQSLIQTAEVDFNRLAKVHGAVNFERESSFALGLLRDNAYLAEKAMNNVDAFKRAIVNVAAIGLSLNPVYRLAYLLPRDGKVILAVSYLGLLKLATDIGAIKWAHADLVYEHDVFRLVGLGHAPVHEFSPFSEARGHVIGCYCVVKTHGDDYLTTHMNMLEVESIRDRSESWKAFKAKGTNSPWNSDMAEMFKKTVIRRAYKTWPMTDTRDRLDSAIDVLNEADPMELNQALTPAIPPKKIEEFADRQRKMLEVLGRAEAQYIVYCTRVCKREIKALEDMTEREAKASIEMLSKMIDVQNAEGKKIENVK